MSDEMPKEIWAGTTLQEKTCGSWFREENYGYNNETPYTLTSHHNSVVAQKDEAIRELRGELERVKKSEARGVDMVKDIDVVLQKTEGL